MTTALIIGGSVLGSGLLARASTKAAETQSEAAQAAAGVSSRQFEQTRADVRPFTIAGQDATAALHALFGLGPGQNALESALLKPFGGDQAALEATPGYQFTRSQGLKAVHNAAAAKGLGSSGQALRGAAEFATGLADQTFGSQFDRYQSQQQNIVNRLMQLIGTGANTGVQTGAIGVQGAANIGSNIVGAGTAQAAGQVGTASTLAGIPQNLLGLLLAQSAVTGTGMFARS